MAHFNGAISYHELMWEIPWAEIQRMLIDAPTYEYSSGNKESSGGGSDKKLSHDELANRLMASINTLPR